jgi:hypothetical protein
VRTNCYQLYGDGIISRARIDGENAYSYSIALEQKNQEAVSADRIIPIDRRSIGIIRSVRRGVLPESTARLPTVPSIPQVRQSRASRSAWQENPNGSISKPQTVIPKRV